MRLLVWLTIDLRLLLDLQSLWPTIETTCQYLDVVVTEDLESKGNL